MNKIDISFEGLLKGIKNLGATPRCKNCYYYRSSDDKTIQICMNQDLENNRFKVFAEPEDLSCRFWSEREERRIMNKDW